MSPILRELGRCDYAEIFSAQRAFTDARDGDTADELWFLEHPPVFTQGQAGKPEHLLMPGDIPVVQSDRGGQVTYHGPGQLVVYFLVDLQRRGYGIRTLVTRIEQAMVETLASLDIQAHADPEAPGVYVDGAEGRPGRAKIGSLGLRVRRACSYHGLSLNVDMDLEPFTRINPCGYQGLRMTQIAALTPAPVAMETVRTRLAGALQRQLGYETATVTWFRGAGQAPRVQSPGTSNPDR